MPHFKCYPISDPKSLWTYCPSYGTAIAFSVLFGVVTIAHVAQAALFRKPFAVVLIMGGIWETAGYIFRTLSVRSQLSSLVFTASQLLIILAPLWINAFVYMTLGRMIHFYIADDRVFRIRARRITLMFVLFDVLAFIVQATGGLMINSQYSLQTQHNGLHIYMGGIGLQLFFITVFITLAVQFQRLVKRENFYVSTPGEEGGSGHHEKSAKQATRLCIVLYAVLVLIIFRNIYRMIEFSAGVDSSVTEHEWYTYVFDATPMLTALVVFNVLHPGMTLRGSNSDFSEENKAIKQAKKMAKTEKKEQKMAKKAEKKEQIEMQKAEKKIRKEGKDVSGDVYG